MTVERADPVITILHLAVDFNTPQRPRTTSAIEWFVDELGEFDNIVVAYLRSPNPMPDPPEECRIRDYRLFHFPYFGLPLGLGLHAAMRHAARRTIALLERENIRPDLIHAHKLTFEGLAGWYIARHFQVPLFVSLRGEVETKVFRMKPRLRSLLRRIGSEAARLYFVSAWFRESFRHYVPAERDKERLLPNIVRNVTPTIATQPADNAFVAILALDTARRKGLRWLLDGIAVAAKEEPDIRLEIIGGGSTGAMERAAAMIAKRGLQSIVTLTGPLDNADLLARMPRFRGMLLPSLNETFGMAYVEALFAGIPVLYTAGTAIDGYIDGLDIGRSVPPRNVPAIATAILEMWRLAPQLRENIVAAAGTLFATFDPQANLARYRADVRQVLGRDVLPAGSGPPDADAGQRASRLEWIRTDRPAPPDA